jgi:hypothetical protein
MEAGEAPAVPVNELNDITLQDAVQTLANSQQ